MTVIRHGLSIGIERVNNDFFLSFRVIGKLTHEDYEKITPMINSALEGVDDPSINVFIDGSELEGWQLRAAWDDFKLGLKHGREFNKVAILGTKKWQKYASKLASWFVSGEVKYFEDIVEAYRWLQA